MKPESIVSCQRFELFGGSGIFRGKTDRERGRVSFRQQHNRLTKDHINLQVHLIVGKLNAALSEGGSIYRAGLAYNL